MKNPQLIRQKAERGGVAPALPRGTDVAVSVAQADGGPVPFSYWDLWFALVAEKNFSGDLEALGQFFRQGLKILSGGDDSARWNPDPRK
jgi:hypothetical protein